MLFARQSLIGARRSVAAAPSLSPFPGYPN